MNRRMTDRKHKQKTSKTSHFMIVLSYVWIMQQHQSHLVILKLLTTSRTIILYSKTITLSAYMYFTYLVFHPCCLHVLPPRPAVPRSPCPHPRPCHVASRQWSGKHFFLFAEIFSGTCHDGFQWFSIASFTIIKKHTQIYQNFTTNVKNSFYSSKGAGGGGGSKF